MTLKVWVDGGVAPDAGSAPLPFFNLQGWKVVNRS